MTGTNGKTSVANFYQQILNLNHKKVASIGTLGVSSKNFNLNSSNTTLDSVSIHKVLEKLKVKIDNVILEASSHGLHQHRLNNINFKTAIFTNLSREHLDYHKNIKNYLNAKLYLFKRLLDLKGNIIFDDKIEQSKQLNTVTKKRKLKKYTFGSSKSFIKIIEIQKFNDQKQIVFSLNKKKYSFRTSLLENSSEKSNVCNRSCIFI